MVTLKTVASLIEVPQETPKDQADHEMTELVEPEETAHHLVEFYREVSTLKY